MPSQSQPMEKYSVFWILGSASSGISPLLLREWEGSIHTESAGFVCVFVCACACGVVCMCGGVCMFFFFGFYRKNKLA